MITTNEQKKALVQQLMDSKNITAEQAYLLLDEPEQGASVYIPQPYYPALPYPQSPWYEIGKPYCGDLPEHCGSGGITSGSITTLSGCSATTIGDGTTSSTVYNPNIPFHYTA